MNIALKHHGFGHHDGSISVLIRPGQRHVTRVPMCLHCKVQARTAVPSIMAIKITLNVINLITIGSLSCSVQGKGMQLGC